MIVIKTLESVAKHLIHIILKVKAIEPYTDGLSLYKISTECFYSDSSYVKK